MSPPQNMQRVNQGKHFVINCLCLFSLSKNTLVKYKQNY